jgi:hypothetical protein
MRQLFASAGASESRDCGADQRRQRDQKGVSNWKDEVHVSYHGLPANTVRNTIFIKLTKP